MGESKGNLKYLKVFLLVLVLFACVSLLYRIILSFNSSSFRYDTYNVLLTEDKSHLIRINRSKNKLSVISFPKVSNEARGSRLIASLALGQPVDAGIVYKGKDSIDINNSFMTFGLMMNLLFGRNNFDFKNINVVDILKIYLFTAQMSKNDKNVFSLESFENGVLDIEGEEIFYDSEIFNEKKSVQVVNSTNIDGLGSKLSDILKSMGYNIIAIESGSDRVSAINTLLEQTVSVKRLKDLLGFPVINKKSDISDVTIILGADLVKTLKKGILNED
jgi:hypothetical protein